MLNISPKFERYTAFGPDVPVVRVTDPNVSAIHRFYDTSPISPTGRYLAYTEFPFEHRLPFEGEKATVKVVNLETAEIVFSEQTSAWDTQVGAHAQWGPSDHELYFNITDSEGKVRGVRVDILGGARREYALGIYMISPDGCFNAAPSIDKLCLVQPGYGVIKSNPESFRNHGAPDNDGLFVCDLDTGEVRLIVSFAQIRAQFPHQFTNELMSRGGLYGFHVKWSPSSKRLMFLVRWCDKKRIASKTRNFLITMDSQARELHLALDDRRWAGGHHPNWFPDSEQIVMNLRFSKLPRAALKLVSVLEKCLRKLGVRASLGANPLRFASFRYDGSDLKAIGSRLGSGHPTISPDGRYLLTDAYLGEPVAFSDGSVPLRLVDLGTSRERQIIRVNCRPKFLGDHAELRVDPHPAWHRSGNFVVFNGCPGERRGVFLAHMADVVL